jgi:DNA-binding protein YbaB
MGEPFGAADDAETWLEKWSAASTEQVAKAQQMTEQVSRVSVSASNRDGSIEVTVSGSGTVTGLRLTEAVHKQTAGQLAAEILRVMRKAQAGLSAKIAEIAADTVGADSVAGRAVLASFEKRYPAEADDDGEGQGYGR